MFLNNFTRVAGCLVSERALEKQVRVQDVMKLVILSKSGVKVICTVLAVFAFVAGIDWISKGLLQGCMCFKMK